MLNSIQQEMSQQTNKQPRDYGFDNIRAILIACVVFGHFLEVCKPFTTHQFIYQTIYSFHIPVFIFLTGYFARYDIKRILLSWVSPFLIFQTLYITVERLLLGSTPYQFSTPYWHLWFLLACVFYLLLIPAYETDSLKKQIFSLICVTALSLAVGFDNSFGHYMALSRFFVFQPWFLLGFYFRKHSSTLQTSVTANNALRTGIAIAIMCVVAITVYLCRIPNKIFYGSYPYENLPYDLICRFIVMITSFVWVFFFIRIMRPLLRRKIPFITTLGQNTLPVYILHAFLTKGISAIFPSLLSSPIYVILMTIVILFLFGNPFVGNIFRFLFSNRILKIFSKKEKIGG